MDEVVVGGRRMKLKFERVNSGKMVSHVTRYIDSPFSLAIHPSLYSVIGATPNCTSRIHSTPQSQIEHNTSVDDEWHY